MTHLTELHITTPRLQGSKVIIDLTDRHGRGTGHAMEVAQNGDLRLTRITSALTADLNIRSTSNTIFKIERAVDKETRSELHKLCQRSTSENHAGHDHAGERQNGSSDEPSRRLARRLFDQLLAAIEDLDIPLRVAPGLDVAKFLGLLEAALILLPARSLQQGMDVEANTLFLEVAHGLACDPSVFIHGSPGAIDPTSSLMLALRAICRVYKPSGKVRSASRTGILGTGTHQVRVSRPSQVSAHQRLAATRLLDRFWRDHPEIGTPQALNTPRLDEMTPLERFILATPAAPDTDEAIVKASGDPRLVLESINGIRTGNRLRGNPGIVEAVYQDTTKVDPRFVRGPAWQNAVDRLLGGVDPAQLLPQ